MRENLCSVALDIFGFALEHSNQGVYTALRCIKQENGNKIKHLMTRKRTSEAIRSRMTLLITTMLNSMATALRWFLTRPLRPVAMALSMSPELTVFKARPPPSSPPPGAADAPQPMSNSNDCQIDREKLIASYELLQINASSL
jgi:hypothetical protein